MIVANWKMYGTKQMVNDFFSAFLQKKTFQNHYIFCLPFPLLAYARAYSVDLGAQNCSAFEEGAYTGEVSANMLQEAGCRFCLVGHSERRLFFHETKETLREKVKRLLNAQITPIFCIGESLEEKQNGSTQAVLEEQLSSLVNITTNIIIAYEPIWAIGTNAIPTIQDIEDVHKMIKTKINTKILYGGSVNPDNAKELKSSHFVDGLLVGRASLKVDSLLAL